MNRPNSVVSNLVATIAIWFSVVLARLLLPHEQGVLIASALAAMGTSILIWMVWAFNQLEAAKKESGEKTKRDTRPDSRLSLLLELMDEDERQALKRRLAEDLSTDGEIVSLADLLKAQEQDSRRQHH